MTMNKTQSFYVKPASNELVNTTVTLLPDTKPALSGTVLGENQKPISNALVTLYAAREPQVPIGALYTDEQGRFSFGPLEAEMLYHVTIFKRDDSVRTLEQP